ncbi:hypothetical protein Pla8534_01510 [Lignipirellula cremea]|uniref:Uncharacterized protein n=2 Tax=Lignipirellula cremea TaxID=2528010 RepID=A0A518DKP2_9BACT|nr:hypothetical protein Pla8534_01510 [Lignipirellula cremea]
MKIHLHGTCSVCHLARFGGPRNEYGNAVNTLLTLRDREDPVRQREVGRRMKDVLANPLLRHSPTFGELFQQGRFPASSLANQEPPLPEVPAKFSKSITAEQARELVKKMEAESRFGILQLSNMYEISPDVAAEIAKFRGDTLILGIKSLSPGVAVALAKSQAANVWLHSVTSVAPEAAEAIVRLRGHLFLTGLVELESAPLAEKLATRPGALSFPYLRTISPQIATALAKNERSLTLAGLTDAPPEVQAKLAETIGALSLPNLESIEVGSLEKKLAAGVVILPKLKQLSPELAKQFTEVKGAGSFFGGVYLSLAAITPEVAASFAESPNRINLILVGSGPISDEVFTVLLKTRSGVSLQDIETLTEEQIRIIGASPGSLTATPGVLTVPNTRFPSLKTLDSPILAERVGPAGFPGVTSISPEAAAALGSLPDAEYKRRDGTVEVRPSGDLNFPSLEELSPETARLLLKKRWLSISFPSLQDVSLETVRLMARQTFRLNLGIPALPSEFADAFAETPTDTNQGGGYIMFPNVTDLSPEAARILVKSLNRGVEDLGHTRISKSPKLYFGGDFGFSTSGFPRLSPELTVELARYEGILAIQGLGELPDESAAALASFPGPYLILSGPGVEKLSPSAAESLEKVPGVLQIQLRELDSVPLAQRFARQISWTLSNLETVSKEAAPALSRYKQFFNVRALTVLDSPEMARRFAEGTTSGTGVTLPALATLSPKAAEILTSGSKSLYLGLTVLDSPEVARALAKSRQGVKLPRLRAATPEVIAILQDAMSIETPPLEALYILSERTLD